MNVRPLPHVRHSAIGKTTDKRGTAYNHVNYILREQACSHVRGENMPTDRDGARPYFDKQAYREGQPENGRVADTVIIALPIELNAEQRHDALQSFMQKIGQGRVAWLAAFHETGEDEHNPHAHLIFRDEDVERGGKVLGTTTGARDVREAEAKGWKIPPRLTSGELRKSWCEHLNHELERLGIDTRFDHRTLKERGINRDPQIHIGPNANAMAEKGRDFDSKDLNRGDNTTLAYSLLDDGNRVQHNQRIIERNKQKEADQQKDNDQRTAQAEQARPKTREERDKRELREAQSQQRRAMYQEQTKDRQALREAHGAQKLEHQRWGRALYAGARDKAFQAVKELHAEKWKELRAGADKQRRDEAAAALKLEQKAAYQQQSAKEIERARPVKDAAWHTLKLTQEKERLALKDHHAKETAALTRQHIAERLAAHETWRAYNLEKETQRISTRLQSNQGMANVQDAALAEMRLKQHAAQTKGVDGPMPATATPHVAARAYTTLASEQRQARMSIREALAAERQSNQIRAAAPAKQRSQAGQLPEQRAANRAEIATQTQRYRMHRRGPRHQPNNVATARGRTGVRTNSRVGAQDEIQSQVPQAVQSGQTVTAADRANASPELREKLDHAGRKSPSQRDFGSAAAQQKQRPGRGRSGGRSGR